MTDAWLHTQHAEFPVRSLCRVLEGSRSGSYEWRGRSPRTPPETEQQVPEAVPRYCVQGRGPYGPRRIKHLLAPAGRRCKTRRQCKAPRASGHAATGAPNRLNRALPVHAPDTVSVGDSTSLPPGDGGL